MAAVRERSGKTGGSVVSGGPVLGLRDSERRKEAAAFSHDGVDVAVQTRRGAAQNFPW